ncbi:MULTISPECIES: MDR family MFS transporter [unclassified Corynebacterium]|uniref:MDR family MFS transporter n=1 Tax=unclassified Corynebacterium TaxID=2624378 RepID=UPI0030B4CD5A
MNFPSASDEPSQSETTKAATPYLAIYVLLAAAFIAILNETVMSVAIPVIKDDVGITATTAQWVTTAFLLTMAVVIPITGFIIGRFPLKTVFALSQGLFAAGTAIGVFAPSFGVVLVARITQAAGTAILLPLLMTTVLMLIPVHKRGAMMGNMSIVIAVAPAIGPTVSGFILKLSNNNWHALFESMLPLGLIVLVVGYFLLPRDDAPSAKPIDLLSVALSAVGFGLSVYALSLIGTDSGTTVWIVAAIGVLGLVAFVIRQRKLAVTDSALLDLRVFKTPSFTLSTILLALGMIAMFGVIIVLPLYMALKGVEVLTIGLILMPGPLVMGLMGPFVGRAFDRVGPRPLVIPGAVMLTLGIFGLGFIGMDTPLWWIISCHVVLEIGLGLLFTPLFTWGLGALPQKLYADGSAITNTIQQVCGAAGTALFLAVATIATGMLSDSSASVVPAPDVIAGYRVAMYGGAVLGVLIIFLAAMVKPHPKTDADVVAEVAG